MNYWLASAHLGGEPENLYDETRIYGQEDSLHLLVLIVESHGYVF